MQTEKRRIVSICPSNTEILADMGALDRVVGVDNYSDWPPEARALPQVGPDLDVDIDKIKALKPDLVVASLSVPGMENNLSKLEAAGLPYIVLNPKSVDEIPGDIRQLGAAIGLAEKAEERARVFEDTIQYYRQKYGTGRADAPSLYWEWWPKPVYTPGRGNWLSDVSRLVGGVNAFDDYAEENVKSDFDAVASRRPDYAFAVWCGVDTHRVKPEMLSERPEWSDVPAVLNGRVYVLEEGLYCRPSPRLLDGLRKLEKIIHGVESESKKS